MAPRFRGVRFSARTISERKRFSSDRYRILESMTLRSLLIRFHFLLTLILLGSTSKAEISGARFHDHPPLLTTEKVELDIDGDGDLDYVSVKNPASHDGQLEVWVNLGGGRWKEPEVISTSIVDFELLA